MVSRLRFGASQVCGVGHILAVLCDEVGDGVETGGGMAFLLSSFSRSGPSTFSGLYDVRPVFAKTDLMVDD